MLWQCQSDADVSFALQTYMDADQQHRQPIMIHRAIFGSIERFFGILVENYAGAFPIWLAPVQAQILPVSPAVADYAEETAASMRAQGLRVEVAGGVCYFSPQRLEVASSNLTQNFPEADLCFVGLNIP